MNKIVLFEKVNQLSSLLTKSKKSIVLVGGCFDITHIGHIKFLTLARKLADVLIILLESDKKVNILKGKNRPIFKQHERAFFLSAITCVDFIIPLPLFISNEEYEKLAFQIKPDFLAITENDPLMSIKTELAKKIGCKMKIIPFIKTYSSSKLVKLLGIE